MSTSKPFIHPKAIVETNHVGLGTCIWAFTHVLAGARIGAECNIGKHCFVESNVVVGDRVVIKNGISLWNGGRIGNDVFLGPNIVLTNDPNPRAKVYLPEPVETHILEGASVGANATLLCGLSIGKYAVVGAGSLVTKSIPDYVLVYGNPASIEGYVCQCASRISFNGAVAECAQCGKRYVKSEDVLVALL